MLRNRVAALTVVAATACGGGGGDADALPACTSPSPATDTSLVPPELQLEQHATITAVARRGAATGITAVSNKSVVELYPPLARAILDAGYSIVSSDNEGFEAEIFFGDNSVTGAYRLREAPCRDQVIVRLLFEERGKRGNS